jgi:hypothetical protein
MQGSFFMDGNYRFLSDEKWRVGSPTQDAHWDRKRRMTSNGFALS